MIVGKKKMVVGESRGLFKYLAKVEIVGFFCKIKNVVVVPHWLFCRKVSNFKPIKEWIMVGLNEEISYRLSIENEKPRF